MECDEKVFGCLCKNVGGHFPCLFHGLNVKGKKVNISRNVAENKKREKNICQLFFVLLKWILTLLANKTVTKKCRKIG